MTNYMMAQKKRIEIDKWLKGCQTNSDPGAEYIFEWIKENAHEFRNSWERSLCKNCYYLNNCGFEVKQECSKYL